MPPVYPTQAPGPNAQEPAESPSLSDASGVPEEKSPAKSVTGNKGAKPNGTPQPPKTGL